VLDGHNPCIEGNFLNTFYWQLSQGVGLVWPFALASGLILGATAWRTRRHDPVADLRLWRHALISLGLPLLLPAWAALAAGVEKNGHAPFPWATSILCLLALMALATAFRTMYRGRSHWYVFLPTLISVGAACFLGVFAGFMEIVDDWV
jgi:hypothetical protein